MPQMMKSPLYQKLVPNAGLLWLMLSY